MNTIQNIATIGESCSVSRGRSAIENQASVCNQCYGSLEFNSGVGPFTSDPVKITKEICYICEMPMRGTAFKLARPEGFNNAEND